MQKKIQIRPLVESDWKDMYEYGSDAETVKFLKQDKYKTEQEAIEHNKQLRTKENQGFAITLNGKMIGMTSIKGITNEHAYIGYVLNKNYWGKGYGTQTLNLIMEHALNEYKNRTFYAVIYKTNLASKKMLEKYGFKKMNKELEEAYFFEFRKK